MQHVKVKIIALWLHIWLKRIAKRYPDFFQRMINDIVDSDKGRIIMHARYVQRLKFKEIPEIVHLEERQVYKIHQQIISKLINL
ncbi:MAG: hypothetical protein IJ529_02140 [Alphaproteobacteria bacterium]|nr:hypothetical protein [Alphaproteobacteria bacterium]